MRARLLVAVLALASLATPALARERSEIPEKYTWNLRDFFPSDQAWQKARDDFRARLPGMAAHRGHLGDSAEALQRGLDAMFDQQLALERLAVYASTRSDEDTRADAPRAMRQEVQQLFTEHGASVSFVRPEILAIGPEKVRAFQAGRTTLAPYRQYLDDVLRWKPHTLGPAEEKVIAEASALQGSPASVYGVLKDADLPWPTVKLSTGEVRLDAAAFTLHRADRNREDRAKVFEAYFGTFKTYQRTFGATLYGQLRAHVFEKNVRGFASSLDLALFRDAIPASVYRQLLADVRGSLPTLHRYLKLRQRMLGLPKLSYIDLYVPLVEKVDLTFTPEEAMKITLEAFAPLGKPYTDVLRKGYESRWTDFLPSTGKRPGAYSWGVWGVHPIQLLNFNGQYDDLSTLAHEAGHSVHRYLSDTTQPYASSDSAIFVAEVASTLNEQLLFQHMMARTKDDPTRLALLGELLDRMRGTLFRQAMFAEFELAIHEAAEKGESLTGEKLSALYLALAREYHGHAQGVCQVDDFIGQEWAYIPHFYRDFYVYQYATSLTASIAFAEAIQAEAAAGKTGTRDRYLAMLKAGGSRYPIELLRTAGVDPTTSAPFQASMKVMNRVMDEMERILQKQGR
jgi:oligoendopeptidase F